ncbi:hypothetical protein KGQ71_02660 [Patescibacteria group bacterium]|nr:hypothetical protein [Patescibacteria group bacterium]
MAKIAPPVLTIATFSLIFIVGFWVIILPELQSLVMAQNTLTQVENQPVVSTVAKVTRDQQKTADAVKAVQSEAETLLPASDNQYDLSVQLDSLSKNLGIPLTGLSITGGTGLIASSSATSGTAASLQKLTLTLSFTTSYDNLKKFLTGLTSIDRYIQINQITVTSSGGGQVSCQVSAFAYYMS